MAVATSDPPSWYEPRLMASSSRQRSLDSKSEQAPRRHAACDECRQRKLKCSGEVDGCSRCVKQGLLCHYSIQKQMGRPPKSRSRQGDDRSSSASPDSQTLTADATSGQQTPFLSSPDQAGALEGADLCPPVYRSYMANNYDIRPGPFVTNGPIFEQNPGPQGLQPASHPGSSTDAPLNWPDFSHISAEGMFFPPQTQTQSSQTSASPSHLASVPPMTPQGVASCSCLSYMYLCLSSLSTLPHFPVSPHTLSTLYTAARTARSVIHCPTCLEAFSSAIQNLMVLGSLLNVIADGWLRVSNAEAEAFGKETVSPAFLMSLSSDSAERQVQWNQWLHHVVQHGVWGSSAAPVVDAVQLQCLESPSLMSLIEELEERQHRIHAEGRNVFGPQQNQPPMDQMAANPEQGHPPNQEYLCLRIVGSAREVIKRIQFRDDYLHSMQ